MTQLARAETTLFLLVSVDGKITSGASDTLDSDKDWSRICGVREGLGQYYRLQESIALHTLNTGRVMEKIGANAFPLPSARDERLALFLVDRKPHLAESGVAFFCARAGRLFIVTNNPAHPAFAMRETHANLEILFYPGEVDFADLFVRLRRDCGIQHLAVESGGTLNAVLVREGLIDHLVIILAPLLVGGKDTSTLMDGYSLMCEKELPNLKALKLTRCEVLQDSYVRLDYDVVKETEIG